MPLSEQEEFELLSLKRKRVLGTSTRPNEPRRPEITPPSRGWFAKDPDVEYTGIPNARLRTGLGLMSTPQEKEWFLNKSVGEGNWGRDPSGRFFVKPEGLKRYGIQSEKPRSIDEPEFTRYDIGDISGDIPGIVGAMGAGAAATGAGFLPGVAATALGGAAGKGLLELGKQMAGSPKGIGAALGEVGTEAAVAGLGGEAPFRIGRGIVNKAMGPGRSRMTPEKTALMEDALAGGFRPAPGAVTDQPLLGRFTSLLGKVVGSPFEAKNASAALKGMDDLLEQAGSVKIDRMGAGIGVKAHLDFIKQNFDKASQAKYAAVDDLAGGAPIVPMTPVKKVLQDYIDKLPVSDTGKKIYPSPELQRWVNKYNSLSDRQTVSATQQMRTAFREGAETRDLPGMNEHFAGKLKKAADEAFDLAKQQGGIDEIAIKRLREADSFYKEGIQKFDVGTVKAIMRRAGETGSVDPEMVVKHIIKPKSVTRIEQVKSLMSEKAWTNVKRAHAEDLVGSLVTHTDDPLVKTFNGRQFVEQLDKYGKDTLDAVYGKKWTENAYKLGHSLMLVAKEQKMTGGLVAANIALSPIHHLPTIALMTGIKNILASDAVAIPFINYMTKGIAAPKTRAGADAIGRAAFLINSMAVPDMTRKTVSNIGIQE